MNIAFYAAAAGMQAFQDKLDVTANNMANVNTTGYKKMDASFEDLLYTNMNTKSEGSHKTGHGSKVGSVDLILQQGVIEKTDRVLDFAVEGTAFFAVDNGTGGPLYTRDGAFKLSMQGDAAYLVTAEGGYVLDGQGARIQVPVIPGTNTADTASLYDRIGLYEFENPYGLLPAGTNLYTAGDNTGAAASVLKSPENKLIQGGLEASMADTASGMVDVIEAQRAFQLNGRIVTTADQLEEMVNNLR